MANLEAFQKNIETLRGAIPELRAALMRSTEGLPVAHWIAGGADPARVAAMADRISAMAAAATNLGKRVSESISLGALMEISVTGAEGQPQPIPSSETYPVNTFPCRTSFNQ